MFAQNHPLSTTGSGAIVPVLPDRATRAAGSPKPAHPSPTKAGRAMATGRGLAAFLWWILTGFGLFGLLFKSKSSRFKVEEIVVYSVHQSFYLWALILTGFVGSAVIGHYPNSLRVAHVFGWVYAWVLLFTLLTLLFDIGTLKFLLWAGIFTFGWVTLKYLEDLEHVFLLSGIIAHMRGLNPSLNAGFASLMSWLLLGPWIGALFHSFSRGRTTFSPNSIEEWHLGEGREITDRSGLKFRSRYRDLLEMALGFGAGDLEAFDSEHRVAKRWENILFLAFVWRRLDEILHQRSAVVDNAVEDPVEVEAVRR